MNTIRHRLMKALLLLIISLLSYSCATSRKTIKLEERRDSASVRTEFVWLTKKVHDSIYLRDSVFVEKKGDTVYLNKWRTRYRERLIHDTLIIRKTDTLRIRESIKSQETQVSWTRPLSHYLIGVALVLLAILFIYKRLTTLL